jgi:hypothetical protein
MYPGVYPMWIAKTPMFAALFDSFLGLTPDRRDAAAHPLGAHPAAGQPVYGLRAGTG